MQRITFRANVATRGGLAMTLIAVACLLVFVPANSELTSCEKKLINNSDKYWKMTLFDTEATAIAWGYAHGGGSGYMNLVAPSKLRLDVCVSTEFNEPEPTQACAVYGLFDVNVPDFGDGCAVISGHPSNPDRVILNSPNDGDITINNEDNYYNDES